MDFHKNRFCCRILFIASTASWTESINALSPFFGGLLRSVVAVSSHNLCPGSNFCTWFLPRLESSSCFLSSKEHRRRTLSSGVVSLFRSLWTFFCCEWFIHGWVFGSMNCAKCNFDISAEMLCDHLWFLCGGLEMKSSEWFRLPDYTHRWPLFLPHFTSKVSFFLRTSFLNPRQTVISEVLTVIKKVLPWNW